MRSSPISSLGEICRRAGRTIRRCLPLLWLAAVLAAQPAAAGEPCGAIVCNVTDSGFVVAWTTDPPVEGHVRYGTDPALLDRTACDVRDGGPPCSLISGTHYVELAHLSPETTYYVQRMENGDPAGPTCAVTTGPALAPGLPETRYGQVFEPDGGTFATGSFVTYEIRRGVGRSALACDLIASVADQGYWSLDRNNVRTRDLSRSFGGRSGDWERHRAYGEGARCAAQIVPYEAPNPAPSMLLGSCPCDPVPVRHPFVTTRTLNKESLGTHLDVRVDLGPDYRPSDIDPRFPIALTVGDGDPIPDESREIRDGVMVVHYPRQVVQDAAPLGEDVPFRIEGLLVDGCDFAGTEGVRVIDEGKPHENAWSEADPSTILDDAERGDVNRLGEGGDGDLGPTVCLPDYLSNYSFTIDSDPDTPGAGSAFFYLYRFCGGTPVCSLGQTSSGHERRPSSGGCP
ncbi:MAG: hypothetical protein D6718_02150 [Acidobacteria bacterium]|nr:MAG: hypothetical protein D6718_02150 [Acidobacteriota bacterium]